MSDVSSTIRYCSLIFYRIRNGQEFQGVPRPVRMAISFRLVASERVRR